MGDKQGVAGEGIVRVKGIARHGTREGMFFKASLL